MLTCHPDDTMLAQAAQACTTMHAFVDVVRMRWAASRVDSAVVCTEADKPTVESGATKAPVEELAQDAPVSVQDVRALAFRSSLPLLKFSPSMLVDYLNQGPSGAQAVSGARNQALGRLWQEVAPASFFAARDTWEARGRRPRRLTSKDLMAAAAADAARTASAADPTASTVQAGATASEDEDGATDTDTDTEGVQDDAFPEVRTAADVAQYRLKHTPAQTLKLYRAKGVVEEAVTINLLRRLLRDRGAVPGVGARGRDAHDVPTGGRVTHVSSSLWWTPVGGPQGFMPRESAEGAARDGPPGPRGAATLPGPVVDPGPFAVVGRVDCAIALETGAQVPVEIKTRMGPLFPQIPHAEKLQLQAYIQCLRAPWGLHVQRSMGSDAVSCVRVDRDDALWTSEVLPGLRRFACDVRRLLRGSLIDEELRHTVLTSMAADASGPARRLAQLQSQARADLPCVLSSAAPCLVPRGAGELTTPQQAAPPAAAAAPVGIADVRLPVLVLPHVREGKDGSRAKFQGRECQVRVAGCAVHVVTAGTGQLQDALATVAHAVASPLIAFLDKGGEIRHATLSCMQSHAREWVWLQAVITGERDAVEAVLLAVRQHEGKQADLKTGARGHPVADSHNSDEDWKDEGTSEDDDDDDDDDDDGGDVDSDASTVVVSGDDCKWPRRKSAPRIPSHNRQPDAKNKDTGFPRPAKVASKRPRLISPIELPCSPPCVKARRLDPVVAEMEATQGKRHSRALRQAHGVVLRSSSQRTRHSRKAVFMSHGATAFRK